MASPVNVKTGMARHGLAIASIILIQTLLILWLVSWVVGDYLNNQYVRAYVDLTVQNDAWMIGALAFVGILGSSLGLVVRHRRHAATTVEVSTKSSKIPRPSLATASLSTTSTKLGTSSPSGTTASAELHPAVAALKADLSEARMSLGLASVTTGTAAPSTPSTGQPAKFEDQKQNFAAQPMTPTRPSIAQTPQLSSLNQTSFPTGPRPIPPTVIRPMAPPPHSSPVLTQQMPTLKVEGPSSIAPKPMGLLPRPEQVPPTGAKDVSTVITGIMGTQQDKKKAQNPAPGQNASSQ